MACLNDQVNVVNVLTNTTKCLQGLNYATAICEASKRGNTRVVKLLLQNTRVDPSTKHNFPLLAAIRCCSIDTLKLLLQDSRINLMAFNYRIIEAIYTGNVEVLSLILQDPRVDPSEDNNLAICIAAEYPAPGSSQNQTSKSYFQDMDS